MLESTGAAAGRQELLGQLVRGVGGDVQQLSFPSDATTLLSGLCSGVTFACNPDLIAVQP